MTLRRDFWTHVRITVITIPAKQNPSPQRSKDLDHLILHTLSIGRLTQRLFVLKNWCLLMFSKCDLSPSGHMALSRSRNLPSDLRTARCPPFLSAAVRSQTYTPHSSSSSNRHMLYVWFMSAKWHAGIWVKKQGIDYIWIIWHTYHRSFDIKNRSSAVVRQLNVYSIQLLYYMHIRVRHPSTLLYKAKWTVQNSTIHVFCICNTL